MGRKFYTPAEDKPVPGEFTFDTSVPGHGNPWKRITAVSGFVGPKGWFLVWLEGAGSHRRRWIREERDPNGEDPYWWAEDS